MHAFTSFTFMLRHKQSKLFCTERKWVSDTHGVKKRERVERKRERKEERQKDKGRDIEKQ